MKDYFLEAHHLLNVLCLDYKLTLYNIENIITFGIIFSFFKVLLTKYRKKFLESIYCYV